MKKRHRRRSLVRRQATLDEVRSRFTLMKKDQDTPRGDSQWGNFAKKKTKVGMAASFY